MKEDKQETNNWRDRLLSPEQSDFVATLFPFKTPPLEVARNCLVITDPNLQLREPYHDTASSIFLFSRGDKKLLVPVVAFDENFPALNLWVLASDTLPITHEVTNRKWAVWCGRNLLQNQRLAALYFTPKKANEMINTARETKRLYEKMLKGEEVKIGKLKELMSQFVLGAWLDYYTNDLPKRILELKDETTGEIEEMFSGFEQKIDSANEQYRKLSDDDRLLLDQAFRVIVKARCNEPFVYFSAEVDAIRKNQNYERVKSSKPRNPLEIVGRTQGVSIDEVESIFIPNEIASSKVGTIAKERMKALGLLEKMRPFSEISDVVWYESCDIRYERFNTTDLISAIKGKRFVPLVPTEWQDCNLFF